MHWTDRLENGVKAHIQAMQQQRDEPASKARPPQAVPDVALADPEVVRLGAGLNKAYAAALRMGKLALSKAEGGQKTVPADYLNVFQHSLTNLFGCDLYCTRGKPSPVAVSAFSDESFWV